MKHAGRPLGLLLATESAMSQEGPSRWFTGKDTATKPYDESTRKEKSDPYKLFSLRNN